MLTEQAIDEMFKWSAWEIIQTKYGPRHRRGCKAGQSEIRIFHLNKMDLTGAGVNLAEFPPMSGKYSLTQWKKVASEEIQRHELQTHLSESAKSSLIIPCPAGLSYMPFQCASVHFALNGLGVDCSPLIPGSQPHPNAFSGLFGMPMIPVQQRRTGFLFADEMGLGKQQPVDSLVMTPSGWKEIGFINVGDFVIGSDGKKTRVNGVFPQGLKKNYRVTFSDGTSVEAGDEHLWTVSYWCGGRWRKNLTLTTQQLRERPKVGRLDLSKIDLYLPMLSAPVTFDPPQTLLIDAFTLGAMLSNGSLTGHSARISCNALDLEHFKSRLAHSAFDTVEGSSRLTVPGMMPSVRALKINVRSGKKSIPRICFTASVRDRIDLFHGLMDGDGSVSKDGTRITYSTTSKRLARDMIELVEGLGGIASMKEYDRTHDGKPIEYSVRIRTPACVPPFSSPRKLGKYKPGSHALPTRSVVSVEYSRTVESVCIAVAAPDRLYLTEHCILTHNTVQAIGLVNAMNALGGGKKVGKILYICPAYLKINNVRELSRWLTERYSIGIADGSVFPSTDIVVINYQILHKWEERLSQMWDIVFVDEAQNLRNDTARMTKAAYGYRKKGENRSGIPSKIRIAMTGTPVVNRPKEFWTTLHWLDPITWSDESRFHWKYCGGSLGNGWTNKGSSSELELQKKLRSTLMIRRLKKDVLTELPPKRREVIVLPNDEDLQLSFNTLEMSEWADRMSVARAKVEWMKTKEDRNEYTAAVQQLQDAIDSGQSATSPVRIATAKKKLPLVIPMLEQAAEDCGKILVFAYHRQIIEALQKALPGSLVIYGGIDSQSRDELVQRFQNDPTVTTAILSIPTAVGMTMTAASNVYFVEEDWTPGNISQAEDRCIAEGQLILTPDGWRKIEDIKVGDYVINGEGLESIVLDAWSSITEKDMVEFSVSGCDRVISTTSDHLFWSKNLGWIQAGTLEVGDSLATLDSNRSAVVTSAKIRKPSACERVYDITVSGAHSFIVGNVIAHNCHRIGQRDSVNVHHLVLENSIDIVMVDQVLRKQKMIDNVLDVDQQRGRDEKEPVIPIPGFSTTFKAIQEEAEKSGHLVQETIQEANRVLENSDALTMTDFELLSRFLKLPAPWPKMVGLIRLLLKSLNTPKTAPKPVTPSTHRQAIERPRSTSSQGELTLA